MIIFEGPTSPTDEQELIFLKPEEIAEKTGMSVQFILSHCRKNSPKSPVLDAYLLGGKYRVSVVEAKRWAEEMRIKRS